MHAQVFDQYRGDMLTVIFDRARTMTLDVKAIVFLQHVDFLQIHIAPAAFDAGVDHRAILIESQYPVRTRVLHTTHVGRLADVIDDIVMCEVHETPDFLDAAQNY